MKIQIGHVERAFAVLLLLYLVASYFAPPGLLYFKLAVYVIGAWAAIRLARHSAKQLIWRLRNRLMIAYFFIAVVPIILITLLAWFGANLVGGQLSLYLVTSELERRTTSLRTSLDFLARGSGSEDRFNAFASFLQSSRYPGLRVCVQDGQTTWSWPEGTPPQMPPAPWVNTSGLVMRDKLLYGWASVVRDDRTVTATFPITREYLGTLAPDLGESNVLFYRERRSALHSTVFDDDEPIRNHLPAKVNLMDFEISWSNPLLVSLWDKPGESTQDTWLNMRTRPSAVLRAVFTEKVDFANETIPMLFFGAAILFLIAEIIALVIGVSITRTITGAVHNLYLGTQHIGLGDFSHRTPVNGNDQLAELGTSFNTMAGNMQRLLIGEKERERLQGELEIARAVQSQLFPKTVPQIPSLRLTAVCNPARVVSGDYYDYQLIEPDKVAIAMGDVAGKGISAALLMATVQSSFRTQLRGSVLNGAGASTSAMVSQLNKQLFADTSPEKYATFILGIYDNATSTLTYTNAGHLPPILIRNNKATLLEVNGMVVGAFLFAKYEESKIELLSGDLLVFYTDGITEPENEYEEMFGEERLTDLLLKNAHQSEPEIVASITRAVRQWTGSDELQDDMTLMLVRRC